MSKKKVAVFGGSGFLGTYLVNELLRRDYSVKVFDKKSSEFIPSDVCSFIDILDRDKVEEVLINGKFDYVYNLAGFANLDKAVNFPVDTFSLNVMGNLHVLEGARKSRVNRYVFASSAYAMSDKGSFYGISKLSSEKIVEEYKKRYQLDYTILRFGSLYSERAFENNYIYNLIEKAVRTKTILHNGDGQEVREYIHAADAARLSVDVLENEDYIDKHLMLTGVERLRRVDLFNMINEILGNQLTIQLTNDGYEHHYKFTPYSFVPQESVRLTPNPYIDMGQGILNCINHVHQSLTNE